MTYYFSAETKGFYHNDVHEKMPPDVVELTDAEYETALHGQHYTLLLVGDKDGKPVNVPREQVLPFEIIKQEKLDAVRVHRAAAMQTLDAEWFKAKEKNDEVAAAAIAAQKQVWRDLPSVVIAATTLEQLAAIQVP
jgi:hypothetical protein